MRGDQHKLIWKLGHYGYSTRQCFGRDKRNINGTALQTLEKAWRSAVFQCQPDLRKFSPICASLFVSATLILMLRKNRRVTGPGG